MKPVLALAFALLFPIFAFAQGQVDFMVGAIPDNASNTTQYLAGIGASVKIKPVTLGLTVFGDPSKQNPRQLTRGQAFATWRVYTYKDFVEIHGGGGAFKFGNEVGGFGRVKVNVGKYLDTWADYGQQNFVQAGAYHDLVRYARFGFGPFYQYTRLKYTAQPSCPVPDLRLNQVGFKFRLGGSDK